MRVLTTYYYAIGVEKLVDSGNVREEFRTTNNNISIL
jgi:hypothetical protein